MFKYIFFFLLINFLTIFEIFSQKNIPMNTWRTHAAYTNAHSVAQTPKRIYCASENGFFYIDKEDNSINELSRLDGLSENEITAISYHSSSQTLIIGYKSGNIDFLKNDVITNIRSVLNTNIIGSKKLNHILLDGNLAYFSADFGVLVLDILRKEIKETYIRIGENGTDLKVFQACFFQEGSIRRLFLATSKGVLSGDITKNLQDFNNWRIYGSSDGSIPDNTSVTHIESIGNVLYASATTILANTKLHKYVNGLWEIVSIVPETNIFNIQNLQNKVYIAVANKIYVFDENNLLNTISDALITNPKNISFDENNKIWLADNKKGLLSNVEGAFKAYIPAGLSTNNTFNLNYTNNKTFALAGGQKSGVSLMREGNLSVFDNGIWKNFQPNINNISVNNISSVCYNSFENKYYFATFGGGVIVQNAGENAPNTDFLRLNETGQTFGTTANITDISIDSKGNMFFLEYNATNSLHIRTRVAGSAGTWTSENAPTTSQQMITTNTGFQIVRQDNNGLWVYDNSKKNLPRLILPTAQEARFSNNILSMVEDKEGVLWLGSDKGVFSIFDLSSRIFTNPTPVSFPILAGKRLLLAENITAIAVDGGNRKWLGTENGVFLVSADGSKIIRNFTFANSPLLSNKILSISINQSNGEIFFATDKGIISYRNDASNVGENTLENGAGGAPDKVCVFPNPVLPDFSGTIGIECLPENATIKITDISGRLIYETRANGASAAWNGRDYSGRRAATGVYIIFATTQDGVESRVGKIAIIE